LRNAVERYVILAGQGRVKIGDLPPTDVTPGDLVVIQVGTPQRISNTGDSDLVFLCICTPRFRQECYESLEQ
jgi:mannose-6-phosphate isomerase-like protein (cupin superfamily)